MGETPDLHPALGPLAGLLGWWRGPGSGRWGDARFEYVEELRFGHGGKPMLAYEQRTWELHSGRPLHSEMGFWRCSGEEWELVLAHGIGVAEISTGRLEDDVLTTTSRDLCLAPTAKPVTSLRRRYRLSAGVLRCTLEMATDGGLVRPHLESELSRERRS